MADTNSIDGRSRAIKRVLWQILVLNVVALIAAMLLLAAWWVATQEG